MSAPSRLALAGVFAMLLIASHFAYRAWPAWRGVEVYVPVAIVPSVPARAGYIRLDVPAERVRIEAAHPEDAVPREPFETVRRIGDWWGPPGQTDVSAWRLRGRRLFVRLQPAEAMWPGGPQWMRATEVSDMPGASAMNVAATVRRVGRLWLSFGSHELVVPPGVAARARARITVREPGRGPVMVGRAADPGVFAVLRVLPSGRAALAGLIVDGARIE